MQTINQILNVFENYRMVPTNIDRYEQGGKELLAEKIQPHVNTGRPIPFVMLGFPMKSANDRDKVLGRLPDMAELAAIMNVGKFNQEVQEVYAPGINLSVASDGFVFNDVLEIQDSVVYDYAKVNKEMSKNIPITWLDLTSFYNENLQAARQKVTAQFGITDEELQRRILVDPNVNHLYNGMIRFMEEEFAVRQFPSNNQLHKFAKKIAREMMFRNLAYDNLVQHEFPQAIRLSIHATTNNGKYSFQLIPGRNVWASPWHCALLVENDGQYSTVHRKQAEQAGYELIYQNQQPYYFKA